MRGGCRAVVGGDELCAGGALIPLDPFAETLRLLFASGTAACFDASLTETFSSPPKEQI